MVEKVPMTKIGAAKLSEELRWRQQEERPRIIQAIAEARAHGDLSENAEYHAAKEAQSYNEGRIGELEDVTTRAEIFDPAKMSGDKVRFGATVRLVDEDTEEEEGRKGRSEAEEIDPAQFAWPTFLTAGTIFGSVIRVDLTKVRVDVETNDLSELSIVFNVS